jgi:hypothetical protein
VPDHDVAGVAGCCQAGVGVCCHGGAPVRLGVGSADCQGGVGSLCHGGAGSLRAGHGCSSDAGVVKGVLEIAGCRVGVSGVEPMSRAPPVCQASVIDRQPEVPSLERHSVVVRHRAVSVLACHSADSERQPTPADGNAGRPVAATSGHRLGFCHRPVASGPAAGGCDHASARSAHTTASGIGSMLPVSVTDPHG